MDSLVSQPMGLKKQSVYLYVHFQVLAMVFGTIIFFNQSYATYLTGFRLEPLLLAGWAIWLLIYLSTLELAQRSINRSKNSNYSKFKTFYSNFHFLLVIEGTSSLSVLEKTEHLIKIGVIFRYDTLKASKLINLDLRAMRKSSFSYWLFTYFWRFHLKWS